MSRPLSASPARTLVRRLTATAALAAATLCPQAAPAAGYGDVTGRVLLNGEAPQLEPRIPEGADAVDGKPVKDAEVCAEEAVPNFGLVTGEENGIANVFLYPLRTPRDVKPELKDAPEQAVVFDQEGCVFEPHALIVRTGQTVNLFNSDPVAHNVRFTSFGNPGINVTVPANTTPDDPEKAVPAVFKRAQRVPIPALCDFHPWMKANWLIVDHPYAAITDADGNFKIEGLPAGSHRFVVWHESAGFLEKAGVAVTVKADGTTDMGDLKYDLDVFKDLKE